MKNRFLTFPAHVQILNMVSDLKKAENLFDTNRSSAINHLYRAIILLDYIIADQKWQSKLRELSRLREVIASLIVNKQPYATLNQTIDAALQLDPIAYQTLQIK
ncbi:MAG: hypothetical protein JSW07_11080 [bacterium]|nr:MAG: hypothetical protein JSW07_11080 [bacterium]